MTRREHRSLAHRGHHAGVDELGQADAMVPGVLAAQAASEEQHRRLRAEEQVGDLADRFGIRSGYRRRCEALAGKLHRLGQLLLLQARIEADVDGRHRLAVGQLSAAQERLDDGHGGARLVVPFRVVAQERPLILRGMDPVDPGSAQVCGDRARRPHDHHRHAVAIGVEDAHEPVHEPDVAVQHGAHRSVGRLRVAVRDRYDVILVQTEQHRRRLVAEIVDEAVVKAAVAGTRVERHVFDPEPPQHGGRHVAAPADLDRFVGHDGNFASPHPISLSRAPFACAGPRVVVRGAAICAASRAPVNRRIPRV